VKVLLDGTAATMAEQSAFDGWVSGQGTTDAAADEGAPSGEASAAAAVGRSLEENHECCAPDHQPAEGGERTLHHLNQYEVVAKGCRNRYCPQCCETLGVKLRERVREKVATWKACLLVTLTIDPTLFPTPADAMERVRTRRAFSRLVRALLKSGHLKSGRYFAAIEFQKNGMPHWHLLLESDFVPIERVQELWDRNRPDTAGPVQPGRPGFGFVWMSKDKFDSTEHAAHYVTKYVLKYPKAGYPDWVLDFVGRIPKYSTSRGLLGTPQEESEFTETTVEACFCMKCRGEAAPGVWKEMELPAEEWEHMPANRTHRLGVLQDGRERRLVWYPTPAEQQTPKRRERQSARERIASCGEAGVILLHKLTVAGGEVKEEWAWLGLLPVPFLEYAAIKPEKSRRYVVEREEAELLRKAPCGALPEELRQGCRSSSS
jgi:hypothetical protein